MPRYRKQANAKAVYVTGIGRLVDERVIEGDYDFLVPSLLERLPDVVEVEVPPALPPVEESPIENDIEPETPSVELSNESMLRQQAAAAVARSKKHRR